MPYTRQTPPFVDEDIDPNGPDIDAAWHNRVDGGVGDAHDGLDAHVDSTNGHPLATPTLPGFESAADKAKLDTALEDFTNEARNIILSGGGDISWAVVADKFKWTARFILMPVSENVASNRFVDLPIPTAGVTDVAGAERASVDGITLNAWESLWVVHSRGSFSSTGNSWKVVAYTDTALVTAYFDDENAYMIAVRNGDAANGSLYIRNGLVLRPGRYIAEGYSAMAPLWTEVDQKPATFPPADGSVTAAKMAAANKGVVICTSTTRPASPVEGQHIYETDTEATLKNTGTPLAPIWGSTVAVDAPLAGVGSSADRLRIPAATASAAGHMAAADKAKLDGYVSAKDYGAVGDGITDDSPAFQAAIDAVFGDGGGNVFVPPGRYLLQTGITVRANVKLVGVGGNKEVTEVGVSEIILMENLRASVILCADTVTATIRLRADGAAVEGLVFYHPNQIKPVYLWQPSIAKALGDRIQPTASADTGLFEVTVAGTTAATEPAWPTVDGATVADGSVTWTRVGTQAKSPIVYPPTVALYPENNRSATVRDCLFVNSYEAIIFTEPHNRPLIENCWIGAYKAGVRIDKSVDSPRVQNVQMMGFYDLAENVNVGQGSLDQFVKDNLVGFAFGRCAWVMAHSLFVYQANIGLHLFVGSVAGGGTSRVPRGKLFGFGADAVAIGILADATDELAGFQVEGFECYVSHGAAYGIQTREKTVDTVTYRPNLRVHGLNFAGPYTRAVIHYGGWLEVSGMSFASPSAIGDAVIRLGTAIRTFRMSGCDFQAGSGAALVIPTGVTGKVFLSMNDLGAQTYIPPTTLPSGGYKAGGNIGIPSSGW